MVLVPLVLPTLVYFGYAWLERRRQQAEAAGELAPWWTTAPWPWLIGSGLALTAVVLATLALTGGSPVGGTYVPAHLEDGRLVPGRVVSPGQAH